MEENRRILIVDDDLDFASLLSDVFSQASYDVEVTSDPYEAEKKVLSSDFSLIVTDLRMPGMDGLELSRKIRSAKPEIPIIMVSGFLDSKNREKMEAEGIAGLYEKPLSVFSLLKNAAKLIEENEEKKKNGSQPGGNGDEGSGANGLDFSFTALPCLSEPSKSFAQAIHRVRNRKQNLCIITPPGVPCRAIAEDFFKWFDPEETGGEIVEPGDLSMDKLTELATLASEKKWSNLTLCIPETDQLQPSEQKQLARGARKGIFRDHWEGHIHFLFMIRTDVETLYQDGVLTDELYLSMGGSEISVPPLRNCPEDIEYLATNFETESGRKLKWDPDALRLLTKYEWPGNHAELRKLLVRFQEGDLSEPIGAEEVARSLGEFSTHSQGKDGNSNIVPLRETLEDCRDSYLAGLCSLMKNDLDAVASVAQIPRDLVANLINE